MIPEALKEQVKLIGTGIYQSLQNEFRLAMTVEQSGAIQRATEFRNAGVVTLGTADRWPDADRAARRLMIDGNTYVNPPVPLFRWGAKSFKTLPDVQTGLGLENAGVINP